VATLFSVSNSDGLVGRCDANCYDARESECDCICGGKNHGQGVERAVDNTIRYIQHWTDQQRQKHGAGVQCEGQLALF
jgi:hypothetical protein